MNMKTKMVILTLVACSLAGCLDFQMEHQILLESDGSVTWQVHVKDTMVAETLEERDKRYMEIVSGNDPVAEALLESGGANLAVLVLRDRAPFEYVVQAEFDHLDTVLELIYEKPEWLTSEEQFHESETRLKFSLTSSYPADEDFETLEITVIDGHFSGPAVTGNDRKTPMRLRIGKPEDWQDLTIVQRQ